MIALLDADIIPYELGAVLGESVPVGKVLNATEGKIEAIIRESKCTDVKCFLTRSRDNFRIERATVSPYKGTRSHEKPYHWLAIREFIERMYDTEEAIGLEADDLIGTAHLENEDSVICSRDKDMDTIPGWHYRWRCGDRQPQRKYYVNPIDAWRFFYYQLLTGDLADNIKGVIGIGNTKATKLLDDCYTRNDLHEKVKQVYINIYGGGSNEPIYYEDVKKNRYWRKPTEIMSEMADLLYIGVDRTYLERFEE